MSLSNSDHTALWCFDDELDAARRLLAAWPAHAGARPELALIGRHRFPDGELKITLPTPVPARVVLWRGLQQPNEKLVELLLVARTARELGAAHLTLVCPYLAYMRQDIAFAPGEAVSQRLVGGFLAGLFDALLTIDPHLHRIAMLAEAVPLHQPGDAVALSAAPLLADWIARQRPGALLLGPDEEAAQWIEQAARRAGLDSAVCRKVRRGDREVEVELPAVGFQGRAVVILDDMASTGHTVAQAARALLAAGAASVDVAVTHALFAPDALAVLRDAGVGAVWSSDSVPHTSNAVAVAPLLAQALAEVWRRV